ncbi:MAG TPA: tetratricopeptide repeat protein [Bacteroidota bacterium]|jgi:tetratricopeptide (TPR) repeat protein|nr:tetratricopeptide repeat protein [Bacteroidota bacterium]
MISRLDQLKKFLEEEPADVFTHYAIALEYVSTGKYPQAIEMFEEVIALDPNYVAAYHQLGLLFVRMNNKREALITLERGMKAADITGDAHARSEMEEARDELGL